MNRLERYVSIVILGRVVRRRSPRRRNPPGPPRDWKYRAWIRTFPCAACGTLRYVECAHVGTDGLGMGQKCSDYESAPLCGVCHRVGPQSYHVIGKPDFEALHGLNFENLAARLYALWCRALTTWDQ